jgi:hypothetical protein
LQHLRRTTTERVCAYSVRLKIDLHSRNCIAGLTLRLTAPSGGEKLFRSPGW